MVLSRSRLSTGQVLKAKENRDVPPFGAVPGGPARDLATEDPPTMPLLLPSLNPKRSCAAILPWKDKYVTLAQMNTGTAVLLLGPVAGRSAVKLVDCNELFVTIGSNDSSRSIPLPNIEVSFDNSGNRLELQVRYG